MSRTAYLINNQVWQDVLSLVPIAVWTEPPSQQPLLAPAITAAEWVTRSDAAAQGVIEFLSADGATCLGILQNATYEQRSALPQPSPLLLRLTGPFVQPDRHLRLVIDQASYCRIALPLIALAAGESTTLFVAADGSTYADPAMQQLAQAGSARTVHQQPALVYYQEEGPADLLATLQFLISYAGQHADFEIEAFGQQAEFSLVSAPFNLHFAGRVKPISSLLRKQKKLLASDPTIHEIVIVDPGDYRTGLMAAPFASLRHALLLFIDPSNLDRHATLAVQGKLVHIIGDVHPDVVAHFRQAAREVRMYDEEQLQQAYVAETLTQQIILVNPRDLQLCVPTDNQTLGEAIKVKSIYGQMSLAAPLLAAAKHALIVPIGGASPQAIDHRVDQTVREIEQREQVQARYLTIVASPEAIPMATMIGISQTFKRDIWIELDGRHYASIDENEAEVDLAVGRIFGLTVSDCSAYIARALFYDQLTRELNQTDRGALLVLVEDAVAVDPHNNGFRIDADSHLAASLAQHDFTDSVAAQFDPNPPTYLGKTLESSSLPAAIGPAGIAERISQLQEDFKQAALIVLKDHATPNGYTFMNTADHYQSLQLNFPIIIGVGCQTCAYHWLRQEQRRRAQAQQESGAWIKPWVADQQQILNEKHSFLDKLQQTLAKMRRWLRSQGLQPPFSARNIRAPASNTALQPPDPDTWPQLYQLSNLFAVQNIRRGAMGQQCSVDLAYYHQQTDELLHDLYVDGLSLGEAFRRAKNAEYERFQADPALSNSTDSNVLGDPQYLLLGDPTFIPRPKPGQPRSDI